MKRFLRPAVCAVSLVAAAAGCTETEVEDGVDDAFPSGKADGGIDDVPPVREGAG